jgi:hypothetical protein
MVKKIRLLSVLTLAVMSLNSQTAQGTDTGNAVRIQEGQPTKNLSKCAENQAPYGTILEDNLSDVTHQEPHTLIKTIDITSLPEEIIGLIFSGYCRDSFANISLTCKKFLILTDKLTESLNSKENWPLKIFETTCYITSSLAQGNAPLPDDTHLQKRESYLESLQRKKKINYSNKINYHDIEVKKLYSAFKNLFTRFNNLTSLDLNYINLSNPSEEFPVTFFTNNSLKNLTNLQFLRISPRYIDAPRSLNNAQPIDTKNRLSTLREELKHLQNLRILICCRNILTDDVLEKLTRLKNLDLSKNSFVTNNKLEEMTSLEYLCLGKNESIAPKILQKLPKLTFLDIKGNSRFEEDDIAQLTNLEILLGGENNFKIQKESISKKTNPEKLKLICLSENDPEDIRFSRFIIWHDIPVGDLYQAFLRYQEMDEGPYEAFLRKQKMEQETEQDMDQYISGYMSEFMSEYIPITLGDLKKLLQISPSQICRIC